MSDQSKPEKPFRILSEAECAERIQRMREEGRLPSHALFIQEHIAYKRRHI